MLGRVESCGVVSHPSRQQSDGGSTGSAGRACNERSSGRVKMNRVVCDDATAGVEGPGACGGARNGRRRVVECTREVMMGTH